MIDLMENKVLGPAIRQGLEMGRVEGWVESRVEGMREILSEQLADRFGKVPAWAEAKLAAASDEALKAWSLRVHRAESLDDLLA